MKNQSNRPNAKELSSSEAGTSLPSHSSDSEVETLSERPSHSSDSEVETLGKDRKSERAEEPASPLGDTGVKHIPGTEIVIGGPTQQ